MAGTFDFIIVGGGTAGCLLAHRLSHASARPSVLLVEAGKNPDGQYLREPFYRYTPSALRPDLQYGYISTPQKELNNRTIPYARGKGLGGSSILNFAVYLYGSAEDYNLWADLVGDPSWRWESVKQSFHAIENYESEPSGPYAHLVRPDPEHGTHGHVKVSPVPPKLEQGYVETMEAVLRSGETLNLEPNNGDPMGISVFPSSYGRGEGRTTSATAHLLNPPENLTIWTEAPVYKLVFDGQRVVGIETEDGRKGI
jgi:choline dehydrogenase-like flavoprotein